MEKEVGFSIDLSIFPFARMSVALSICLCVVRSVYLSIRRFAVYRSVGLSKYLSVGLSIDLSAIRSFVGSFFCQFSCARSLILCWIF